MSKRFRVLLVDDSATARAALRVALADEPALEVVGEAVDGASALQRVRELAPDIITMDVFLRAESGIELAALIMQSQATPIVVVTAASPRDPSLVFRAMQAGALEVCGKLPGPSHVDYEARRARLVRTLKTLASVPVVHRKEITRTMAMPKPERDPSRTRAVLHNPPCAGGKVSVEPSNARAAARGPLGNGMLLIGASTGGPPVLAKLLRALPRPFPLPIAVVQHMASGFMQSFADWLADDTRHPVTVLSTSRAEAPGVVYLPADDHHLAVELGGRLVGSPEGPRGFYRPSVDLLFESAAERLVPARTIAVLLTGMGSDGAQGLLALRNAGAHTLAQEPRTCTVSSMPQRAIELGAVERVLSPDELAAAISLRAGALVLQP